MRTVRESAAANWSAPLISICLQSCKMYSLKFWNVFVYILRCTYLSRLQTVYVYNQKWTRQNEVEYSGQQKRTFDINFSASKMYLSTFQNVFVKIANCICPYLHIKMNLSKLSGRVQRPAKGHLWSQFVSRAEFLFQPTFAERPQIWPSCRKQHCPMMWVLQHIFRCASISRLYPRQWVSESAEFWIWNRFKM